MVGSSRLITLTITPRRYARRKKGGEEKDCDESGLAFGIEAAISLTQFCLLVAAYDTPAIITALTNAFLHTFLYA